MAKVGVDIIITYHSKADETAAVVAQIQQLCCKAVAIQPDTANLSSFADFSAQLPTQLPQVWQRGEFDFLVNNAGFGTYAAIKGAVAVLSRYLALGSGDRGIRVNRLAPGAIETDVGGVVQMLLSEQSGWINGQRIEVSGGIHL